MVLTSAAAVSAAPAVDPDETITFDRGVYFITADAGEQVRETLIIKNSTSFDAALTSEVSDMAAGRGSTTAFEYLPIGEAPRGAGTWVAPIQPRRILVPAREQTEVELVLDVPADAGAGGHFAAVTFTTRDPRPNSQVRFDLVQPIPLFITVRGEFERDLRATIEPDDRWRWSGGRATWTLRLRNEGDVHEPISGRVVLDGLLAGSTSSVLRPGVLFPGEERDIPVRFNLRSAPDLYTAQARVDLDDHDPARADAPRVVVLPVWVLVLLAVAIVVIVVRIRTRRRNDAWSTDSGEDDDLDDPFSPAG